MLTILRRKLKKDLSDQTTQEPLPFDCPNFAECEVVRTAYEVYLEMKCRRVCRPSGRHPCICALFRLTLPLQPGAEMV